MPHITEIFKVVENSLAIVLFKMSEAISANSDQYDCLNMSQKEKRTIDMPKWKGEEQQGLNITQRTRRN